MGDVEHCESGGDFTTEALAALAFAQLHLDTVTVDIRVQADRAAHGQHEAADGEDPAVFVMMVLGHKDMRERGKMYTMPLSLAKRFQRMGVVRAMTDEEIESHAKAELDDPARVGETPDISHGLTTAARIHHVRQTDPNPVAC